jgi:hypothetical protein
MMIGPRRMTSAGRQLRDGISTYLLPENRHRLARSRCMTAIPNCDRAFLRLLSQSRQPTA